MFTFFISHRLQFSTLLSVANIVAGAGAAFVVAGAGAAAAAAVAAAANSDELLFDAERDNAILSYYQLLHATPNRPIQQYKQRE